MFEGIPREGIELLGRLPRLDKDGFAAVKPTYRAALRDPIKAFVTELGKVLQERVSGGLVAEPKTHGSIGPINNDVRFNPNAATYKDHLLLRFWEGDHKKTAPSLYVRLTATDVGFATGAVFADVDRWRHAVSGDGDALQSALRALLDATDGEVVGRELKRVPRPWDADHPHGGLLRHKWIQVRWSTAMPDSVTSPSFVDHCAEELVRAAPVHAWLVEHLG